MIRRFDRSTALLIIDAQQGINEVTHWGGPTGRRNNPDAEPRIRDLLTRWRERAYPVVFTRHDSREEHSPLKISLPSGAFIPGLEPQPGELIIVKDVNGGFIGTNLEIQLRRLHIERLVVAGFFTNMCVETTVRQSGNLGYDTYLVMDACATCNRIGPDGTDYDPQTVHALSVASMHGEFCTALTSSEALALLERDAPDLEPAAGNRTRAELVGI
jgi:nicotinamidase-related amidase